MNLVYTPTPQKFHSPQPQNGWMEKKEIILARMTRSNLKPKTHCNFISLKGPKGKPTICNYSKNTQIQ